MATLPTITDPSGSITDVLLDGLNIPTAEHALLVLSIPSTNSADQLTVEGRASEGINRIKLLLGLCKNLALQGDIRNVNVKMVR